MSTPAGAQKRAVIYARISLDKAGDGVALERQLEACRDLASRRGWQVVAEHQDASISAYTGKKRPGWNEVLALVETGRVEVVVSWAVDRMTRSMKDLESLIDLSERHAFTIVTTSGDLDLETPQGKMVARILASVAAQESEHKGARQTLANTQRALAGGHGLGTRPYGITKDGTGLVEEEAAVIKEAGRRILAGHTLSATTAWFEEAAHRSWSKNGLRLVLIHPRMIGKRVYKGEIVADTQHPPFFTEAEYIAIRDAISQTGHRKKTTPNRGRQPQTLLAGIAHCGVCGGKINASNNKIRGVMIPSYRCKLQDCFQMDRATVDRIIRTTIPLAASRMSLAPEDQKPLPDVIELQARLQGAVDLYAKGALPLAQLETLTTYLQREIAEAEEALAARTRQGTSRQPSKVRKKFLLSSGRVVLSPSEVGVFDSWDSLSLPEQRSLIDEVTERIELRPHKRGYNECTPRSLYFLYRDGDETGDPQPELPPKRVTSQKATGAILSD